MSVAWFVHICVVCIMMCVCVWCMTLCMWRDGFVVVICGVCDLHADLFVCGLLCCVLGMYVVMLVAWFVCVWCFFVCIYYVW